MARVTWTREARNDVRRLTHGLDSFSPGATKRWARKLLASTRRLVKLPESGVPVEDAGKPGYREIYVGPYRVVYRYDGKVCEILIVVRAVEDLSDWLP